MIILSRFLQKKKKKDSYKLWTYHEHGILCVVLDIASQPQGLLGLNLGESSENNFWINKTFELRELILKWHWHIYI